MASATMQRPAAEREGHRRCADGRTGTQQAEAVRADSQNVAGENREQGRGPAKQDGEKVERDGSEDDFVGPNVGEALANLFETRTRLRLGTSVRTKSEKEAGGAEIEQARTSVGDGRRKSAEHAADPRPDHEGDL